MDLSWLNPLTVAECLIGACVLLVVLRFTGFSISKEKGASFGGLSEPLKRIESKVDTVIADVGVLKTDVAALKESDTRQDKALRGLSIDWYKRQVYNEGLPYVERVYAGLKYLDLGGNSNTLTYFNSTLRDIDPTTFDTIVANWRAA